MQVSAPLSTTQSTGLTPQQPLLAPAPTTAFTLPAATPSTGAAAATVASTYATTPTATTPTTTTPVTATDPTATPTPTALVTPVTTTPATTAIAVTPAAPATATTTPATTTPATTTPATTTPAATTPSTTTPTAPVTTPPTTATPTISKAASHPASAAERLDAVMKRIASHAKSVETLPNGAKLYHLSGGRVVEQVDGHNPYVVKAGNWAKHPAAKKA